MTSQTRNRFLSRICAITRIFLSVAVGCLLVDGWMSPVRAQPPIANQPGLNQPPVAGQPGVRQPRTGQPGTGQPPIGNQPGVGQPPIGSQPGVQPGTRPGTQPGTQPPATKPPATKPPAKPPTGKPPAGKDDVEEQEKPPAPEVQKATSPTPDGWEIYFTYYPPMEGKRAGKETVPVILLHEYGGTSQSFSYLAVGLQTLGYAVIAPDLRGHGRSTKNLARDRDYPVPFDSAKFNDRTDITNMVFDVEKCRAFLRERNNAGDLNIDLTCVIGAEMGAVVALNWTLMDWTRTESVRDMYRTGKNVKGLILLSPERSFKGGANATAALAFPLIKEEIPIMVAVGAEDRAAYSEAMRIYSPIERIREKRIPRDMSPDDPRARIEYKKSFIINAPTTLQGTKLLARPLPVNRAIVKFLEWELLRVVPDHPWMERLIPGEVPSGT